MRDSTWHSGRISLSNKLSRFLLFALLVPTLFPIVSHAQDTLTFINGKQVICASVQVLEDVVVAEVQRKRSTKTRPYAKSMVYSIEYTDGTDTILYQPDPAGGDDSWSTEEMKWYVAGQQDARSHYRTYAWGIGGFVVGAGAGFLAYDQFYVIAVPVAYTVAAGIPEPKLSGYRSIPDSRFENPAYRAGFLRVARSRKLFTALKTSVVGTALGVTLGNFTN